MSGRICLVSLIVVFLSAGMVKADAPVLSPNPGKVYIDAWGWLGTASYQRYSPPDEVIDRNNPDCRYPISHGRGHIVGPDYFKVRVIDESYKWGANLMTVDKHMSKWEKSAGWTQETEREVYRHAHHRGMLVMQHHCGIGAGFDDAIERTVKLMEIYNDGLNRSWNEMRDANGAEQWAGMTPQLFTKCAFPYNPAMCYTTNNKRFSYTLPNYMDGTATNGRGCDDVSLGYNSICDVLKKQYGRQNVDFQLECRDIQSPDKRYGGLGFPDWRLKQVNDIFRYMARDPKHASSSTGWWINEPPDVCSKESRIYCYGISQDPIKAAIATNLESTGRDSPRTAHKGKTTLKGRYNYPYTTHFIQNNYFRVYVFPDKEEGVLLYDPEILAHYDKNSKSFHLTDSLIETISNEKITNYKKKVSYPEPVGYKAILKSEVGMDIGGSKLKETRTYTILNDTPYIRVKIESEFEGPPSEVETKIGAKGYDELKVGGKSYNARVTLPLPERIKLIDSTGKRPDLHIFIFDKGIVKDITWNPGDSLYLGRKKVDRGSFEIAIVVPTTLYDEKALSYLYRSLQDKELTITLNKESPTLVKNSYSIPLVKVVKVKGGGKDPYLVNEYGWWMFRGAQVSQRDKKEDYLKVYLEPKGKAEVRSYGFINGLVKPGWGCQYILAIKDVKEIPDGGRCKVKVMKLTQAIFAPRVEFREDIKTVKLNGNDWCYFDENLVFLPNRRGEYQLEVMTKGEKIPHLTRTYAHVSGMGWDKGKLSFQAGLPEGITGIPEDYYFYGLVKHKGYYVEEIKGGDLVRMNEGEGTVFRFKPGQVMLKFSQVRTEKTLNLIDFKKDVSSHLSRMQIRDIEKYVKSFKWEKVDLKKVRDRKTVLKDYDVLIWNQFYQKELPEIACEESIKEKVKEYLEEGGGLLLIGDALPYVCDLGIEENQPNKRIYESWRERRTGLHLASFGVMPLPEEKTHPLFSGLRSYGGDFTLVKSGFYYFFKMVGWAGDEPENGRVLGRFFGISSKTKERIDGTVILTEWTYGKGKVIGYGNNLKREFGTPDGWEGRPLKNERKFIKNVVKYLSAGKKTPNIGLVCW